jgi:hypothetical protein
LILDHDQQTTEEKFLQSWDAIEKFYARIIASSGWAWLTPIFSLIAKLRERGYDRQFRAGQSLTMFSLSRSLNHGLRNEQPAFGIEILPDGTMHLWYHEPPNENIEMDVDQVEITPEVEEFLARLVAHPID